MKSILILLLSGFLYSNTSFAQHKSDIPVSVSSAFAKSYPGASKVKWDKENNQYEASFKYKNKEMSVVYNMDGTVAETETPIATNMLPAQAQKYATAKGKIKEASKIVLADGTVQYEAEVNGKDLMFDDKGNFIKEKVESDDKD